MPLALAPTLGEAFRSRETGYSSFNGASCMYDTDGNVARKYKAGVYDRNYFWSAANQLDSTSDGGTTKHYDYNAFGEPVRISTIGATSSYLIWDGDNLLAELDASGNRIADYTYGPGAIDAPFAVTTDPSSSAGTQYGEIDELGNVIGTSALGGVSQSVSYDAWGTPTVSGSTANRLLWKGLLWESGPTQLYYMRSRWYDPEAGRFVSEDPIGQAGGINLYAFGDNDPVNASDPSGAGRTCKLVSGQYDAGGPFKVVVVSYSYWVCVDDGDDASSGTAIGAASPVGFGGGMSASGSAAAMRQIGRNMQPVARLGDCVASGAITGAMALGEGAVARDLFVGARAAFGANVGRCVNEAEGGDYLLG